MSKPRLPYPSQLVAWCQEMVFTWRRLSTAAPELIRLAKLDSTDDGFPRSSLGGGNHGGDVSRPTERAGLTQLAVCWRPGPGDLRCDHHRQAHDETGCRFCDCPGFMTAPIEDLPAEWLDELFALLPEVKRITRVIGHLEHKIASRGDVRADQGIGGNCSACGRPVDGGPKDRLRSGMCNTCHRAWLRFVKSETDAGREPSPVRFRAGRAKVDERRKLA